jgi:ankyrin repeat protein
MSPDELSTELLQACRENNLDDVNYWLEMSASPIFKKDDWSPLLWASCNGNEAIVRALLKHNAHSEYVHKAEDDAQAEGDKNEESKKADPFGKIPDAKKIGKYTPLHWASYKGHYKVVWLLLKAGLSPLDQDIYGNTSIHQAAASGNLDVLKCFLSRGVDID